MEILAFILVSIGVVVVPGPNVLVIVSTSLSHGKVGALQTVAGTSSAMLVQLSIAAVGTSLFVTSLAQGLSWLKWVGVAYLAYLGVQALINAAKPQVIQSSAIGSFMRGFWVSLTNPKTILFFGAFLPQFATSGVSYEYQIFVLSCIFWFIAVILDSGYALLAWKCKSLLVSQNLHRYQNGICGFIYLGASALLAGSKNPN